MNIADVVNPPFGSLFAPKVFHLQIDIDGKYSEGSILNYDHAQVHPANSSLHYAQSVFEGMKAYRLEDGEVGIFRPELHAKRFRRSALKMAMPDFPEDLFLDSLKRYVSEVRDCVPATEDHSLYLRPVLFSADDKLKVGAANKYNFYILSCVVGDYFAAKGGMRPAKVLVNPLFIRAYKGGVGEAKTAANYALSIPAQKVAEKLSCDQTLYLDAEHHKYIDELGGMNFFAVRGNTLVTPELNGCILEGVTRRSLLELGPVLGLEVSEEQICFNDLVAEINQGTVTEVFACGTAAVVNPIGQFLHVKGGETTEINLPSNHKVALSLRKELQKVQRASSVHFKTWSDPVS